MKYAANRYRSKRAMVTFTEEEYDIVRSKMAEAQQTNFAAFAREALLTGTVKHIDFHELREFTSQLGHLSGYINQIAYRCNESRSVYENDVQEIRKAYLEVKAILQGELCRMIRRISK